MLCVGAVARACNVLAFKRVPVQGLEPRVRTHIRHASVPGSEASSRLHDQQLLDQVRRQRVCLAEAIRELQVALARAFEGLRAKEVS